MIIVLWAVVMLSAVGSSMIATGRTDVMLARNLSAAAIAMAAADGAIQQAAFHAMPCPPQSACTPWPTDGTPVDTSRDGIAIAVCLSDEAGKINPNQANAGLLAALLGTTGMPATDAARLAQAIVAWRSAEPDPAVAADRAALYRQAGLPFAPDGQSFAAVDDLRFVLGMTPAVLDRLRPELSVYNTADPDPALASATTRRALQALLGTDVAGLASLGTAIAGARPRVLAITATATIVQGARFSRSAVVGLERDPGKPPLRILSWTEAPQAPCG